METTKFSWESVLDNQELSQEVAQQHRAFSNPLLAFWRLGLAAVLTTWDYAHALLIKLTSPNEEAFIQRMQPLNLRWLGRMRRAMGLKITVEGTPPESPALLAPNHISYVDVIAVGACAPCTFVAKADVLTWPVVGAIFKIGAQIAVSRKRSRTLPETLEKVGARLRAGISVCVFFEATTTNGEFLRRFYSALAQPSIDTGVPIVPVALTYAIRHPGTSVTNDVAYINNHVFGPHLWRMLGLRGVEVTVQFGEPISPKGHDRRSLTDAVRAALSKLHGNLIDTDATGEEYF